MWRKTDETEQKLLLWELTQRKRKRGRPRYSYFEQLRDNTGFEKKTFNEKDAKLV